MNKIIKMLCAACTLAIANIGLAQADSSNFAGPYIGVSISGYGMQIAGTSQAGVGQPTEEVSIGQVAPIQGFEGGYAIPLGSMFLLDIGAAYHSGSAELEFHHDQIAATTCSGCDADTMGAKDVTFAVDDLVSFSISPTLVLSDTSSVYVKVGLSEADVEVTGDTKTYSHILRY